MQEQQRLLFVGNPFYNWLVNVNEEFLKSYEIEKEITKIEPSRERIKEIWKSAIKSENNGNKRFGGSGAIVMSAVAHLGLDCSLIGRVGKDKTGKKIREFLEDLRVESRLIESEDPTGIVLCLETLGERTMITYLGSSIRLNLNDFKSEELEHYRHWHIEGYAFFFDEVVSRCFEIAEGAQATISINLPTVDVVRQKKVQFQEVVRHIHHLFGDQEELMTLTDTETVEEALMSFDESQLVCATGGAEGCWIKAPGDKIVIHINALKVDRVTNKTCAGDVWTGIFLALFLKGVPVVTCGELANHGAAEWIQQDLGGELPERVWESIRTSFKK